MPGRRPGGRSPVGAVGKLLQGLSKAVRSFSPEEYQDLARQNGFRVLRMGLEDRAWDFQTREAFVAFGRATFVEWTRPSRE
jgi:hypothetical protein